MTDQNNTQLMQKQIDEKTQEVAKIEQAERILNSALETIDAGKIWLNKSYLAQFDDVENFPIQVPHESHRININADVRLYKLDRLSLENKQSMLESLTAMYHAVGAFGCSAFLFLDCKNQQTDVYLGVKGLNALGETGGALLVSAFKGHFSGSQFVEQDKAKQKSVQMMLSPKDNHSKSISVLTAVPSLSIDEREHYMQGLERFIDAAEKIDYQAIILAEPVSNMELDYVQQYYENIATQLSPLLKQQISFSTSTSESIGTSISKSISESFTQTESTGTSTSFADSENVSTAEGHTKGTSHTNSVSTSVSAEVSVGIPFVAGEKASASMSTSYSYGVNESFSTTKTISHGKTTTIGQNNQSSSGKTDGTTDTTGENFTDSTSQSQTISFDSVSKNIEQILNQVDSHLERIQEAKNYGGWQTAAYFITKERYQTKSLASIFLGLMRGEGSYTENSAISTWSGENAKGIFNWLENFAHPRMNSAISKRLNLTHLSPATLVSGKEMAIQLSLPRSSTSTVSVVEAQAFGRQIQSVNGIIEKAEKSVHLGKIRHLWETLPQNVDLDVQKLASHIFITGSTGAGKSNTVYQLLSELNRNDVKFMVIEPAKGEYKNVFGHRKDVKVFGTNPKKTALLRINPFKFPEDVHVLEHIDRLVEIFNVCWPMYAAMPAVLKDAMLEAYKASGWDLDNSCNAYPNVFPNFNDLLSQLKNVIDNSAFSQEVRSNYEGSLVTRVKSLTNGLNGQIFTSNEVDNQQLFDENVIVDLSRVGSQETKALMMGILVMRLSEYRMSESSGMNEPLKHVTVLEEAHNILKRTSTEQSSEGSNVAGKAVEMLSNAIAEMRTYGEGFIIADQSPSAVDISAIRNTNTKIIMRLPDETDRKLAGKSAGVTDEQLEELAKLPKGVAVIYQNDWLEPVLCQVERFEAEESLFIQPDETRQSQKNQFAIAVAELLFNFNQLKTAKEKLGKVKLEIENSNLSAEYKSYFSKIVYQLEIGKIPLLLQKDTDYLIDLYQRIIRERIEQVAEFLPIEVQQNLFQLNSKEGLC